MKITIHRGIDQIGGCITEIATTTTRILIDLGQNLPDGDGVVNDKLATQEAVENLTRGADAIFYTHYHDDHIGLFHLVPDNVPQYVGSVAKHIALCKHRQLSHIKGRKQQSEAEIAKLEKMGELAPGQAITVGNVKVIPYFVSHSAYDAYMFLVEADGKRVLHTGDFRGHGYLSKGLLPTIQKLSIPQNYVDFLITEGTMLSRLDEKVMSEYELQKKVNKIMTRYKNVFVMCSSTDMERLATYYAANKLKHRPLMCDLFQKSILEIFTKSAGKHTPLFCFEKIYDFRPSNTKLLDWMVEAGFCMFIRATDKFRGYYRTLSPRLDPNETVLIYSMWKEYINPDSRHAVPRYMGFVSMFPNVVRLHTTGHAAPEFLAEVCQAVNPLLGIIPIHSEASVNYASLPIGTYLRQRIVTSSTVVGGVTIEITPRA